MVLSIALAFFQLAYFQCIRFKKLRIAKYIVIHIGYSYRLAVIATDPASSPNDTNAPAIELVFFGPVA